MKSSLFDRRSIMRGALYGSAVAVGIPTLDLFLDNNGEALANGRPLPVRFGTYFWGLGLTDTPQGTRWVPTKQGADYEITPELESIRALKNKVSVFSGFRAIGDGKPNLVHWSGIGSIMSGVAPGKTTIMDAPSLDITVAQAIGQSTRFRALDISASGKPISHSTYSGTAYATPEITPLSLYQRLFGDGFQDPNNPDWAPDPRVMLRQSVLSAVKDQRDALQAGVGQADRVKLDQYYTSVREMEKQLEMQLERPEHNAACLVPERPGEARRGASVDIVNANSKMMARLLAMGLVCNQTNVFNFIHSAGASETYLPGDSKIYHQYSHDEPTDAELGYQVTTSKLAGVVMEALGDFLTELDSVQEGNGTVLDNSIVLAYSDTGYAKIHSLENIPMFLAGGAGGRHKAGQHIHTTGEPVTRVSLTAMQLAGAPVGEFGDGAMKTSQPMTEVMA